MDQLCVIRGCGKGSRRSAVLTATPLWMSYGHWQFVLALEDVVDKGHILVALILGRHMCHQVRRVVVLDEQRRDHRLRDSVAARDSLEGGNDILLRAP